MENSRRAFQSYSNLKINAGKYKKSYDLVPSISVVNCIYRSYDLVPSILSHKLYLLYLFSKYFKRI